MEHKSSQQRKNASCRYKLERVRDTVDWGGWGGPVRALVSSSHRVEDKR